jgi:hypothetical protein
MGEVRLLNDVTIDELTCTEALLYLKLKWAIVKKQESSKLAGPNLRNQMMRFSLEAKCCMLQTARFGIDIEEPDSVFSPVVPTPSYKAWFNSWDDYFQNQLSPEEFAEFEKKAANGEDISAFHPARDWREELTESEKKLANGEDISAVRPDGDQEKQLA